MKVFVIIFALINVIFFAIMRADLWNTDSVLLVQPALNEAKIRLLAEPIQSAVPVAASASIVVPVTAPTCMEWSDFSGADLNRASAALETLQLGKKLSQRPVEYNIGYWVYLPPAKDKASVAQKIAQLKARGVEEYFVVQEEGEWKHAISLGVFKTEDAAQKFLQSLLAKDIRSAKIGERASKLKATIFILNELDAASVEKLSVLQKEFPSSELKKLACR